MAPVRVLMSLDWPDVAPSVPSHKRPLNRPMELSALVMPWKYRRAVLASTKALVMLAVAVAVLRLSQVAPSSRLYQAVPLLVGTGSTMARPKARPSGSLLAK